MVPGSEINAITFHVSDMPTSVRFYQALGFQAAYGGETSAFTSFEHGENFVNLQLVDQPPPNGWGRVVLHVESPDVVYQRCLDAGIKPEMAPSDAPWGERYFHVRDPDGHELSFACKL
ncbi:MAG: catechol 2,3-dioxygenase-like lactoylglutathione lyase family enzyme [Acidimicrobiales bacterium]